MTQKKQDLHGSLSKVRVSLFKWMRLGRSRAWVEGAGCSAEKTMQEGRNGGKTENQDIRGLYQPLSKIKKGSDIKNKNRSHHVEDDEGDHQHQDGAGGSGLRGASAVPSVGVNILHSLVVSVQEKHHGATGPDHEANKHDI